jgi:hypothetical protein
MAMVFVYKGLTVDLEQLILWDTPWTCHLYKAGPSPILKTNVAADFTECDFGGYVDQDPAFAGPAFINGAFQGEIDGATMVFAADGTIAAPQDALGYYVLDDSLNLLFAEEFTLPAHFVNPGDTLNLVAKIVDDDL